MKFSLHRIIPFLAIILQLPIPKTRLSSIPVLPSSYPSKLASRSSSFTSRLLFCPAEHFFITTLHGPRRKQPVFLKMRVYWSVTQQWTSFCCTRTLRGNMFTESLRSNGYIGHSMYWNLSNPYSHIF
jgi:hypothetical protein